MNELKSILILKYKANKKLENFSESEIIKELAIFEKQLINCNNNKEYDIIVFSIKELEKFIIDKAWSWSV